MSVSLTSLPITLGLEVHVQEKLVCGTLFCVQTFKTNFLLSPLLLSPVSSPANQDSYSTTGRCNSTGWMKINTTNDCQF